MEKCEFAVNDPLMPKLAAYNKDALGNPALARAFDDIIASFCPSKDWSVHEHDIKLKDFIKEAALDVFGPPRRSPLKPWVSPDTWRLLQRTGHIRQSMMSLKKLVRFTLVACCFLTWRS